jgi:hypothetical protein
MSTLRRTIEVELGGLWTWWAHQLHELFLSLVALVLPRAATQLLLFAGAYEWSIWVQRGTKRDLLGTIPKPNDPEDSDWMRLTASHADRRITVGLASERVLQFDLSLPIAAGPDLDSAMPLLLQREIPLRLDRMCVDWSVVARQHSAARIVVRVWAARSSEVQEIVALANAARLRIAQIGIAQSGGKVRRRFRMAVAELERRPLTRPVRGLTTSALILVTGLVLVVAAQDVYERVVVSRAFRAEHSQAVTLRRAAAQLKGDVMPALALARVMSTPDAADALLALSKAVPPDAWVYDAQIRIEGPVAHIQIMGSAPTGVGLEQAIERVPGFHGVALVNSFPEGIPSIRERFQIMADWSGNAAAGPRTTSATVGSMSRGAHP